MKKTLSKRIFEMASYATEVIPSPLAYLFYTNRDCSIYKEEMHIMMEALQKFNHDNGLQFGYVAVTDETPSGYHFHLICFVSGRSYGDSFRFGAMLNKVWSESLPGKAAPFIPERPMYRLKSEMAEFLKRCAYFANPSKEQIPISIEHHGKRYWSSHKRSLAKNAPGAEVAA